MSDTRRDFLAKCLGGAAFLVAGGVGKAVEGSVEAPATVEDFYNAALGVPWEVKEPLHIRTDLKPLGTRFVTQNHKELLFVNEMLIQFLPGQERHWVGLGMTLVGDKIEIKHRDRASLPYVKYPNVNRNGDAFPVLFDEDDRILPLQLLSFSRDPRTMLDHIFVAGLVRVHFTSPVKEHDISFMRCSRCGHFDRCHIYEPVVSEGWTAPAETLNTAQRACPKCRHEGREQLDFHREDQLYKVYMTPTTSHVVLRGPDCDPAKLMVIPGDLDLATRPMWMAKEASLGNPIAQLEPKPSYLGEVFASTFGPLFNGM